MNAQPKLSSAELQRGHDAVTQELTEARAEHAKAAYAHALDRNDEVARQALIKSKQRLDLLEAELTGLGAATGEAKRLERITALNVEIAQWEEDGKTAVAAAEAAEAAFAKVNACILALGTAYRELQTAERQSNCTEAKCAKGKDDRSFYSYAVRTESLVDGLLWLAIGGKHDLARSDVVMDGGGTPTPERPAQQVAMYCERAKDQVRKGVQHKTAALRDEVAVLGAGQ